MAQENQQTGITCEQADLLMTPMWKDRKDWVTRREDESFNAHLDVCSSCAKEFIETARLLDFLRANWTEIKGNSQNLSISTEADAPEKQEMQRTTRGFANIQEAWADFQRRCPEFASVELPPSSPSEFDTEDARIDETEMSRISSCRGSRGRWGWLTGIAACLIIGGLIWMRFHGIASHFNQVPPAQSLIPDAGEIVRVKQVMPDGTNITLPTNGPITTSGHRFKRLRINENRQIVLNRHTALSIEPLKSNHLIGCVINLKAGRIQAHVEPDGNPFEVLTPHGKAVITGTVFDVSVTQQETTLIVAEGSVRFESSQGRVDVRAGFQSTLQAQSRPSTPTRCDAESLLAWANGAESNPAIERPQVYSEYANFAEMLPLQLSYPGRPIDLESIDYEEWVESKRVWFKGQFPWIFELNEALMEKALLATSHQSLTTATVPDYPELLIETGDIWQIVYPHRFYWKIPTIRKESLLRVARTYELGSSWLGYILPEAGEETHLSNPVSHDGENALAQWIALARECERTCDDKDKLCELYEYSAAISKYLSNTRTLVWLDLQSGNSDGKDVRLHALERQVASAWQIGRRAWEQQHAENGSVEERIQSLVASIKDIQDIEKHLRDSQLWPIAR